MVSNSPLFLIDTCTLVNIRDLHDDSDTVWDAIRAEIKDDRLKSVRQVTEELAHRFPKVYRRVKDLRKQLLVPDADLYTGEVIAEVRAIHQHHPTLYDRLGGGNPADPMLIAVAKTKLGIVVTDEKMIGPGYKSRIPYVCTSRNVGCTSRLPYLKQIGLDV